MTLVNEYAELLATVKDSVTKLGFTLIQDLEFSATFGNGSDWKVVFEGERFVRPAFDLLAVLDEKQGLRKNFSIRLLMKVFSDNRRPSLENQLDFLISNRADIFTNPPSYEKKYELLNMSIVSGI